MQFGLKKYYPARDVIKCVLFIANITAGKEVKASPRCHALRPSESVCRFTARALALLTALLCSNLLFRFADNFFVPIPPHPMMCILAIANNFSNEFGDERFPPSLSNFSPLIKVMQK